jgi:hypothetical protein
MPRDERGLKTKAGYQQRGVNETTPDSPSPPRPNAHQSKTQRAGGLTERRSGDRLRDSRRDRAASTTKTCLAPSRTPVKGENTMNTSSARKLALGAAIAASMGIGYAIGAQPHMSETITILQSARAELTAATPNKGGHRERALGLIDQAIAEVRAGMAFAGG